MVQLWRAVLCRAPSSRWSRIEPGSRLTLIVAVAAGLGGCSPTLFAVHVNSASSKLEEARALGAETLAPYEYWMAREHLDQARSEAAESDYGDAIDFAESSEGYSEQAIEVMRSSPRTSAAASSSAK